MAFVAAGVIFIITVCWAGLQLGGAMMSDSPEASDGTGAVWTFIVGTLFAVLVGATHWLPHVSW